MSWRFPDSNLTSNRVITDEGLNDGFMPAATEAQGKINEHNLNEAILPSAAFGSSTFLPDTHVETTGVGLEFVNTRGTNQTAAEGGPGATRAAWTAVYVVESHNPFPFPTDPELDGGVIIDLNPVWSVIGAKSPPFQQPSITSPRPMSVAFFADQQMSIWVMATLQVVEEQKRGQMFALKVNGALVAESMFGSEALTNERTREHNKFPDNPRAEVAWASPAAGGVGAQVGYSVCIETVIEVPPGDVRVDVVGVNVAPYAGMFVDGYDGRMNVGGREIVILKLMR